MAQTAAARLLTWTKKREQIAPLKMCELAFSYF